MFIDNSKQCQESNIVVLGCLLIIANNAWMFIDNSKQCQESNIVVLGCLLIIANSAKNLILLCFDVYW